jgi:hypothetical protein
MLNNPGNLGLRPASADAAKPASTPAATTSPAAASSPAAVKSNASPVTSPAKK